MPAPAPIYRGQGNVPFRSEERTHTLKRGQTSPYDINGAPPAAPTPDPGSLNLWIVDLPLADALVPLWRAEFTDEYIFANTGAVDAKVAATGSPTLPLFKDGLANGSVSAAGVISFSDSTYPVGSVFEIYPPATPDATWDQVSVTLDLA